jgi:hypothetical protein
MSKSLKLPRELEPVHRGIDEQLAGIVDQLSRQADSMFDGKPWSKVSLDGFGDYLIAHGKALIALGENFNAGKLPQWKQDQDAAYNASVIGQLQHGDEAR